MNKLPDYKDENWQARRARIFPIANIRADLYFLTTEEGGRKSPRYDGYAMPIEGPGFNMTTIVFAEDPNTPQFELGHTYKVRMHFIDQALGLDTYKVGDSFRMGPPSES